MNAKVSPHTENKSSPFLARTIEHWLDSANELTYQLPFCQVLLTDGYEIVHTSRHNAFEQGKDIIAIASDNKVHGFQLKGGNISLTRWRNEVKAELEELRELTIVHPSVPKGEHTSWLVTNGELEDTVRVKIDNLNRGKWQANPLQVQTRGQLLSKFLSLSEAFVPTKIDDYKDFLDLYFWNQNSLMDEAKFCAFVERVLCLDEKRNMQARSRDIAASVLYTSYIGAGFELAENWIAAIQTFTLLGAHILAVAEKYKLPEGYWAKSYSIVWHEIARCCVALEDDVSKNGLDQITNSMWDGAGVLQFRRHLTTTYLLAWKLSKSLDESEVPGPLLDESQVGQLRDTLLMWGESSVIPFLNLFFLVRKEVGQALPEFVEYPLKALLEANGKYSEHHMLSPYYTIVDAVEHVFNIREEPIEESFRGRSCLLKSLITICAKNDLRQILEKHWRAISHIQQEDFTPSESYQYYRWRNSEGSVFTIFANQEESWQRLVDAASSEEYGDIPETIKQYPSFLPLFLTVYPHRAACPDFLRLLDDKTLPEQLRDTH